MAMASEARQALAALVPLLWIARICLTADRVVLRYYQNPMHRPPL